jgi:hypothetical protein
LLALRFQDFSERSTTEAKLSDCLLSQEITADDKEDRLDGSLIFPMERGEKDLCLTTLVKLGNTFRIPIGKLFS